MLFRLLMSALVLTFTVTGFAVAQEDDPVEEPAEALEQEAPAFDPEPFLGAMVNLRGASQTCDAFVNNEPVQRTQGIVGYFEALGQALPDLADEETQASLSRFIGSQAAMLCRDMLDAAFAEYFEQATIYEANRPQEWPVAPAANPGQWCAMDYCLDR